MLNKMNEEGIVLVQFAIECAEKALPFFEDRFEDIRPRLSIVAAKRFLNDQSSDTDYSYYSVLALLAGRDLKNKKAKIATYIASRASRAALYCANYHCPEGAKCINEFTAIDMKRLFKGIK
jgi:hypothetical protein